MKRKKDLYYLIIFILIIFFINIIGQYYYKAFDLTGDKRYTLTEATKKMLRNQKDVIFVKVLLEGDFPAGFKRLQNSVKDVLNQFRSEDPYLEYMFENPLGGTPAENNKAKEKLRKEGIIPVNLFVGEGDSRTEKSIYPYAVFHLGKRMYVVNLLEPQVAGVSPEETLNNSVALLEYKFANAIQKLTRQVKGNVVFVSGKGEIDDFHLATLYKHLNKYYHVAKLQIDSTYRIHPDIDVVIVPRPTQKFTIKNKFVLDQYLMKGGNIIWLIDKIDADLDSINKYKLYTPRLIDTDLDDLFFKYGIRINNNLVQDLQCTRLPQVIGMSGDVPQIEKFPWYYHLLVNSISDHPVSKGLSDIYMPFVSTVDTLNSSPGTKKTVLLTSSARSKYQMYPMRLTYQIMHYRPDVKLFNKSHLPVSVLTEGYFTSFFKNRLTNETRKMLEDIGESFEEKSIAPGKMIFVGDGDFIKNLYNSKTGEFTSIGYNKWEKRKFHGNEDFIMNAIEFMMDESGILAARAKRVKLRLLDKAKLQKEKFKWQMINIALPLLLLALFGLVYNYYRKRKWQNY